MRTSRRPSAGAGRLRYCIAAALIGLPFYHFAPVGPERAAGEVPTIEEDVMAQRILVHITHGPEHPTRAALGFAVAHAALEQGHEVTLFLAGDAVQLLREGVLDHLAGLGTGRLRDLHDGIVAGGGRFFLSGGSSQARGLTATDLGDRAVEMAGPGRLVELALEHDRMFTY